MATLHTAMEYLPAMPKGLDTNWLHQTATIGRPITRMDIHVLTIQTARTMIGVSAASDFERAVRTEKILRTPLKALGRECFIHMISVYQGQTTSPITV